MKKLLVNLISEQTIPVLLSINSFPEAKHHLFITTRKMEDAETGRRSLWLKKAANLDPVNVVVTEVLADDYNDIMAKLGSEQMEDYYKEFDEIIVNITGGNKLMSIAVNEFFKGKTENIYYLPIHNETYVIPNNPLYKKTVNSLLSIETYLGACGLHKTDKRVSFKQPLNSPRAFTFEELERLLGEFLVNEELRAKSERLRLLFRADDSVYRFKKDKLDYSVLPEADEIDEILTSFGFSSDEMIGKKTVDFITGGWYEEYVYYLVCSMFEKEGLVPVGYDLEDFVKIGVQLSPKAGDEFKAKYFTSNDLDVIFILNSKLYVIECKSGGMDKTYDYNRTVYMQSALRKYFGLSVTSVLCTLSSVSEENMEKAKVFGIKVLDKSYFANSINEKSIKDFSQSKRD